MSSEITTGWSADINLWCKNRLWKAIAREIAADSTIATNFILDKIDVDARFEEVWEQYSDWFIEPKQAERGGKDYWHDVSPSIFLYIPLLTFQL